MIFSWVLLIKIIVTMIAVVGLSLIAEHVSTRIAGILAGFPHGIAIVLYFIGLEQGAQFASQASIYAIGGLGANVLLVYVYFLLCNTPPWNSPFSAAVGSIVAFLGFAFLLHKMEINQLLAGLIAVSMIALIAFLLRHVENISISRKMLISHKGILVRALLATAIVLIITTLANLIGPNWSGLLAGFPVVTLPLLLIIHFQYGKEPISTIIKNYPFGLFSLVVYTLTVSFAFPVFGINIGTLLGFIAALFYLAGISFYRHCRYKSDS